MYENLINNQLVRFVIVFWNKHKVVACKAMYCRINNWGVGIQESHCHTGWNNKWLQSIVPVIKFTCRNNPYMPKVNENTNYWNEISSSSSYHPSFSHICTLANVHMIQYEKTRERKFKYCFETHSPGIQSLFLSRLLCQSLAYLPCRRRHDVGWIGRHCCYPLSSTFWRRRCRYIET